MHLTDCTIYGNALDDLNLGYVDLGGNEVHAPTLTVTPEPIVPDAPLTLQVERAMPSESVGFAFSTTGTASTPIPWLYVPLSLEQPRMLGPIVPADEQGIAVLETRLPARAARYMTLWFQGAQQYRTTQVEEVLVRQ